MSAPLLTYSEHTGFWYAKGADGAVARGRSKREARDALATLTPIPSAKRAVASHGQVIHAPSDTATGTRCNAGRRGTRLLPTSTVEADVTCGGCLRIGTSGKVRPIYPQYPSADYCPTCGLSLGHWAGCAVAS